MKSTIESLNQDNFQSFLSDNLSIVRVHETPEYEYHQYLCIAKTSKKVTAEGKFARQC